MLHADAVERLARSIHERYVEERMRSGVAMGATPAMTEWDYLDEDKREANRAQARDIVVKLARIGCVVAPLALTDGKFAFTERELDLLARHEQIRWICQRLSAGWVYGRVRDDRVKAHPNAVPWDQLPETERRKDWEAVHNIPAVLAEVDLGIIRRRTVDP